MESRNIAQRYAISYCVEQGDGPTTTYAKLKEGFGNEVMSRAQVFRWHKMFCAGRTNFKDENRSGRPSTSRTEINTARVREIIEADRTLSVRMIADEVKINRETVRQIVKEDLDIRNSFAKMLPKNITRKNYSTSVCENMYQCQYCSYKVRYKTQLNRHLSGVHNNLPRESSPDVPNREVTQNNSLNRCSFCFFEAYSSQLDPHILTVHSVKPHRCRYCDYSTDYLCQLSDHLNSHDDMKRYSCSYCDYKTAGLNYLTLHMRTVHKGEITDQEIKELSISLAKEDQENCNGSDPQTDSYICDKCSFLSTDLVSLNEHIQRTHQQHWTISKRKDCSSSSDEPSPISGKKMYKCSKCEFVTIYESLYNEHKACNHTKTANVRWHHCNYCSFSSIYPHSVKRHYETLHFKIRNRRFQIDDEPKTKTFRCDFCNEIFMKKILIKRHIFRDHDSDKPFKCIICDYKAGKRQELSQHMRLHTNN